MMKVILRDGFRLVDYSLRTYSPGNIVTYTIVENVVDSSNNKIESRDLINLDKSLVLGYIGNVLYITDEGYFILNDSAREAFTLPGDF